MPPLLRQTAERSPPRVLADLGAGDGGTLWPLDRAGLVGETIYAESEVLAKRESQSRPTQGVVTVRTTGRKADGTVFISYERTVLVPKQGHAVED